MTHEIAQVDMFCYTSKVAGPFAQRRRRVAACHRQRLRYETSLHLAEVAFDADPAKVLTRHHRPAAQSCDQTCKDGLVADET
eukprot:3198194-Amphidinium_carterae.1